jgi:Caspase recruitment domain
VFHVSAQVSYKLLQHLTPSLVKIIEPDFGLLDELLSRRVLDDEEWQAVRAKPTVVLQNKRLLRYLRRKTPAQRQQFSCALDSTGQAHIVNWIESQRDKDGSEFNLSACFSSRYYYPV